MGSYGYVYKVTYPSLAFVSHDVENFGKSCKAQLVYVDQRTALCKSDLLLWSVPTSGTISPQDVRHFATLSSFKSKFKTFLLEYFG